MPTLRRCILPVAACAVLLAVACAESQPETPSSPRDDGGVADSGGASESPDGAKPPRNPVQDGEAEASLDAGSDAATATDADAAACATSPCGLAPQCGCASTETCDVTPAGLACVGAGAAKAGAGCVSTSSCAAGLVCIAGACRAPCAAVGALCGATPGSACRAYDDAPASDGGAVDAAAGAPRLGCTVPCELADRASCGYRDGDNIASGCSWSEAEPHTDCRRVASKLSSICESDADCTPGKACVPYSGFSACRKLCKVGDPNACGECSSHFSPPRIVGGLTYGTCST